MTTRKQRKPRKPTPTQILARIHSHYGERYAATGSCDDRIARALRGKTDDQLEAIARDNGLAERWASYAQLNPGLRRMSFGNVLRGVARRSGEVRIGATTIRVGAATAPKAPRRAKRAARS
jgi:hypothetical protein